MLNARLSAALATHAGATSPAELRFVQCSSVGATATLVLQAWQPGANQPGLVVKTPRNPHLRHSLENEWLALQALQNELSVARLAPKPVARFELDGAQCYAYEGVPGRSLVAHFRDRILESRSQCIRRCGVVALEAATALHSADTRPMSGESLAHDLLSDLDWLEAFVPALPSSLAARARASADWLARHATPLPCGRIHGDFSPSNLMVPVLARPTEARLIDWEHTEGARPQHLDLLRFVSAATLMGARGAARMSVMHQAVLRDQPLVTHLLSPWLRRMGVEDHVAWTEPPALDALWWHYWTHAARRAQERLAVPLTPASSTLLRGLMALATADGHRRYNCAAPPSTK